MELSSIFGGDTLKAADLQGTEPVVTIASVEMKKFDNGNKLIVKFVGKTKSLVANKTNSKRIAMAHGSNTDGWIGKQIQLYIDIVDFQGEPTEAIRVRPLKPQVQNRADMITSGPQPSQRHTAPVAQRSVGGDPDDQIPFAPEVR